MKQQTENPMRKIFIRRVVLSCGAVDKELEKSAKLLTILSGMKTQIIKSGPKKRIPAFGVKPKMELGARVTLRNKKAEEMLKRLLGALENRIKKSSVQENHFSFGIKEYIEIPNMEYNREIGNRGLNVTIVFERPGVRIKNKKIKRGHLPGKQHISSEEIMNYMEEHFKTKFY